MTAHRPSPLCHTPARWVCTATEWSSMVGTCGQARHGCDPTLSGAVHDRDPLAHTQCDNPRARHPPEVVERPDRARVPHELPGGREGGLQIPEGEVLELRGGQQANRAARFATAPQLDACRAGWSESESESGHRCRRPGEARKARSLAVAGLPRRIRARASQQQHMSEGITATRRDSLTVWSSQPSIDLPP